MPESLRRTAIGEWFVWLLRDHEKEEDNEKSTLTIRSKITDANIQTLGVFTLLQCIVNALDVGLDMTIEGTLNADSCRVTATGSTDIYHTSEYDPGFKMPRR